MSFRSAIRLAAPLAAGLVVLALLASGVTDRIELPLRDLLLRLAPPLPAHDVSAVVIDDASLAAVGRWPWPRATLADLADRISAAEPRAVVFDILLAEASAGDGDLAARLAKGNGWLVAALDERGEWVLPTEPLRSAARLAHASVEIDHDGVARRLAASKQSAELPLTALSLAVASLVDPTLTIAPGRSIVPSFRVRPSDVDAVAAHALLSGADPSPLRGRVVFVGLTALGLGDAVVTPVSRRGTRDPGVLVHAAVTQNLIDRATITELPPLAGGLAAAALVALLSLLATTGGFYRAAGSALVVAAPVAAGAALLATGIAIPFATLALTALVGVVVVESRSALLTWRETAAVTAILGGSRRDAQRPRANEERIRHLQALASALAGRRADDAEMRRVMAHELKTPLTSVRGLTQLLADFDLTDQERHRVAHMVANEAVRLQMMVDRLLEIERIALRDFARETSPVDLAALVRERVALLGGASDREISSRIDGQAIVRGDALLLERVLENLVANAIKFSPPQTAVEIALRRASGEALLEVRDHGSGIGEEEREAIFRRFSRGRSAKGTDGFGLGLALVAEIVAWHGGTIDVQSAGGGGSLFRISLPLMEAST